MTGLWSSPGRAVQAHVGTFDHVDRATRSTNRTFDASPSRVRYWRMFARSYSKADRDLEPSVLTDGMTASAQEDLRLALDDQWVVRMAHEFVTTERDMLNRAVTHYVSLPIIDLVTNAADLAEPEPLFPTDLPCPSGLAVLETPIIVPDLDPEWGTVNARIKMPVRAVGWHSRPVGNKLGDAEVPGVWLIFYTDQQSYEDVYLPSVRDAYAASGRGTAGLPERGEIVWPEELLPIEVNPWAFGSGWANAGDDIRDANVAEGTVVASVAYERRWTLSFFRLIWQRILTPTTEPWDRAARRRADRVGINAQRDVTILKLRRVADDVGEPRVPDDERGWTLNHRVIVRGHWRRQWYRSLGPVGDDDAYRMVWIDPYIKGPESGPLILKHSVTSVVR